MNYKTINKESWNKRTETHFDSDFYDNTSFRKGRNSLNQIELDLLGNVAGKKVLHLQCHFGQDTMSLSRMGAKATGVDISDVAISKANSLAHELGFDTQFVCCDLYDTEQYIDEQFDVVFSSYGTIGWLPDMDQWAKVIYDRLKVGGEFVFAEFHPMVWMYDDAFSKISYDYFNTGAIEYEESTYTDGSDEIHKNICWNHGLSEVLSSLLRTGINIVDFREYDYSPYPCFDNVIEYEPNKYRIKHIEKKIPMVYSLKAKKY